ncbi:MAG: hypothetical protein ACON5B_01015 [Myxococcota bacterium]
MRCWWVAVFFGCTGEVPEDVPAEDPAELSDETGNTDAERVTVTGQLLGRTTDKPVVGTVRAIDGSWSVETDETGLFSLELSPGRQFVVTEGTTESAYLDCAQAIHVDASNPEPLVLWAFNRPPVEKVLGGLSYNLDPKAGQVSVRFSPDVVVGGEAALVEGPHEEVFYFPDDDPKPLLQNYLPNNPTGYDLVFLNVTPGRVPVRVEGREDYTTCALAHPFETVPVEPGGITILEAVCEPVGGEDR